MFLCDCHLPSCAPQQWPSHPSTNQVTAGYASAAAAAASSLTGPAYSAAAYASAAAAAASSAAGADSKSARVSYIFWLHFGYIFSIETALPDRNGVCGRAAACKTDRNGVYPPDLCFFLARDQLYITPE